MLMNVYEDLAVIEKAFNFASEIHENEKRFTGEAYINHPIAVSLMVAELNLGPHTVAAALLHDAYESNPSVLKKIDQQFGEEISFLVQGLSKVGKIEYHGIERSAESVRKMFMATAQDVRVIVIKLFDRLDNMQTLYVQPKEKQKRIALETLEIYAPVADRLGMGGIKLQLEDASFKYTHPEEYEWIIKETREKIPERENYLVKKVIPALKKELEKEKIPVINIKYRAKNYYSLWKKLLRNNMDWYRIYDLIAVRIHVKSIETCYSVLGAIHKLWKPLPGRIKDYISLPKQNGYQSLHTTVFCIDKKIVEFQIRTEEMDEEAEQGIAAHWAWEITGKQREVKKMPHKELSWVKQLQEWHKRFHKGTGGEKFLEALKIDFFKDRVFVLTPKGEVIDLPEKATPIDFAYHIHSEIGDSATAAKVNNRIVPLSYELESGDIVEILTDKNKKPTAKTLDYAKTSLAQSHIRAFLNKRGMFSKIKEITDKKRDEVKTEITVTARDKTDIIKEISSVLHSFRIKTRKFISETKDDEGYTQIQISFSPKNKNQADKIATRIKDIKGVEEVKTETKEL